MTLIKYPEDTINHTVVYLLTKLKIVLGESGMKLAMENHLQDLKGLVEPVEMTGADLVLLSKIDNEIIGLAVGSIVCINNTMEVFVGHINGMLTENDGARRLAGDFYYTYFHSEEKEENLEEEISLMFFRAMYISYELRLLVTRGEYNFNNLSFNHFLDRYAEDDIQGLLTETATKNQHEVILNELIFNMAYFYERSLLYLNPES